MQATAAERAMCHSCNTEALRKVVEAFQQRWAWLLSAAYASELEQYSVGGPEAAAPVTLGQFLTVTEMSREVESMCSAAGSPAAAVLNSLKTLGKHLLKVCNQALCTHSCGSGHSSLSCFTSFFLVNIVVEKIQV